VTLTNFLKLDSVLAELINMVSSTS